VNKTPQKKNKFEEVINNLPDGSFRALYTRKFKEIYKGALIDFGEKGYIEVTKRNDGAIIYTINDIANDRKIFVNDSTRKLEKIVVDLKNVFIDTAIKAFHISKHEIKEYESGIAIYQPNWDEALSELLGMEFDGKLLRIQFSNMVIREPVFYRARGDKIEVFIDYRYFLDALFYIIRSSYVEFVERE